MWPQAGAATKQRDKVPFDIAVAMRRFRKAVKPFPKAALFKLAEEGFASVFEQHVACMNSIRTRMDTSTALPQRLLCT